LAKKQRHSRHIYYVGKLTSELPNDIVSLDKKMLVVLFISFGSESKKQKTSSAWGLQLKHYHR
jgi:hypothetical protein